MDDDDEYPRLVASRVRGAWYAAHLKGPELARLLGVTPESARAKLRGGRELRLNDLRKIADRLGTTVGEFTD